MCESAPIISSPGPYEAQLGQKRVFHANAADIKEIDDFMPARKVTYNFALFGGLDVLVGGEMVQDKSDFFPVENRFNTRFFKFPYCNGRGNVVTQHKVDFCLYKLSGGYTVKSRMRREDFLSHCHAHVTVLPFRYHI